MFQLLHRQTGLYFLFPPIALQERSPIYCTLRPVTIEYGLIRITARIHIISIGLHHLLCFTFLNDALAPQSVRIELARSGVPINNLVHLWLSHHRLILFIVPETTKTHHVYNDIFLKFHTKIKGNLGHHHYRFRIVSIDMKNRCFDHF